MDTTTSSSSLFIALAQGKPLLFSKHIFHTPRKLFRHCEMARDSNKSFSSRWKTFSMFTHFLVYIPNLFYQNWVEESKHQRRNCCTVISRVKNFWNNMKKKIEVKAKLLGEKVNYSSDDTPRCALSLENGMPQRKSRFWVLLQPNKKRLKTKGIYSATKYSWLLYVCICLEVVDPAQKKGKELNQLENWLKNKVNRGVVGQKAFLFCSTISPQSLFLWCPEFQMRWL